MKVLSKLFISGFCLITMLLTVSKISQCQDDATWWNEVHHWNGITPWQEYIIYSPAYMGPNALPVPWSQKGIVRDRYEFQVGLDGHFSKGDKTQDVSLSLYFPVVKNKIALEFYDVPYEHYQMDESTVIARRARNRSGIGFTTGDIYFSTIVQIIRNKKFPDIALRMACKTASGLKLSDARFTDSPGYFFDLSFGKDLIFSEKWINKLRLFGMGGFYVWQMGMPNNQQNDAILYGAGFDIHLNQIRISNSIEGYSGYFNNTKIVVVDSESPIVFNDCPVVWRTQLVKQSNHTDIILGYQGGLNDFNYQSINISILIHFNKS
jgi:hypothetical protein